jgi:MoaA/NifB/PqqE/SkfB family radical SAM enzyme
MLPKARLLVTYKCPKNCDGCCNKEWKGPMPTIATNYKGYEEIMLTGGEPMLYPAKVISLLRKIKAENPHASLYMYTATYNPKDLKEVLPLLDGVCITLHAPEDIIQLQGIYPYMLLNPNKSFRINVFDNINTSMLDFTKLPHVRVKQMVWIKDCPLPTNEEFIRLENLW